MFIKGSGKKEYQGKSHSEKGEYGSKQNTQATGPKGTSVNWSSKWQGTKLMKGSTRG